MSEDRGRSTPGTDPTLTPSQVGVAPTSASATSPTSATELASTRSAATGALPGRYSLGAKLGAGGMGEVLLANDRQIEREVAIKRMRLSPTPDAIARFEREAKIQGRLDHPAIVPVHELAIDSEGRPFFVMKRLTGTTLAELLARGDLARQKLLRAFADVCLAIEFAHSRRVVHRDLKPANIMLGDYGEVYVLDWGVARLLDDERDQSSLGDAHVDAVPGATAAGAILGTPGYIAPELLRGMRVDGRADVYALGCILFEILCGESLLPPGRAALEAALGQVDARPSQRASGGDVPPELDALCVSATSIDPEARPSARELATSIEKFLDGDRDLALRKNVAAAHAATARDALATGDGEAERATAMREAGRAIAIDPENRDAGELVARLMLEPPRVVPREVEERVAEIEMRTVREKIARVIGVEFSFLLFIPLVLLMGLRSGPMLALFAGAIVVNIAGTLVVFYRRDPSLRQVYAGAVLFAGFIGLVGNMFSPFLIAPAMAAVSLMMFVADPRIHWVPMTLLYIASVFVPWLLEVGGVVHDTATSLGGDLVIHSNLVSISMPEAELGFAFFTLALLLISGYMATRIAQANRTAVRTLELQAWHLRQLVN